MCTELRAIEITKPRLNIQPLILLLPYVRPIPSLFSEWDWAGLR